MLSTFSRCKSFWTAFSELRIHPLEIFIEVEFCRNAHFISERQLSYFMPNLCSIRFVKLQIQQSVATTFQFKINNLITNCRLLVSSKHFHLYTSSSSIAHFLAHGVEDFHMKKIIQSPREHFQSLTCLIFLAMWEKRFMLVLLLSFSMIDGKFSWKRSVNLEEFPLTLRNLIIYATFIFIILRLIAFIFRQIDCLPADLLLKCIRREN